MHTTHYQALEVRRHRWIVSVAAAAFFAGASGALTWASSAPQLSLKPSRVIAAIQMAQAEGEDEAAPPSDQVDKYIAVYTAMQRDHNLTVDQAASKQGLTVAQFRALENRIERNPVVHDRVLQALKAASKKPASKAP